MKLEFGYTSDSGAASRINQDGIGIWELTTIYQSQKTQIRFFALADGMGGHDAGEIASRLAISSIAYWLTSALFSPFISGIKEFSSPEDFVNVLEEGVFFTNEKFRKRILDDHLDLGSTLLLLLQVDNWFVISNIGDCRAYLLDQNDELRLLTADHSLAFRYYLDQQIEFQRIVRHPDRNKLFCSLGDPQLINKLEEFNRLYRQSNIRQFPGQASQTILLCSDGIWVNLSETQIRDTLRTKKTPEDASKGLVELARNVDGQDNSSAIVIHLQ